MKTIFEFAVEEGNGHDDSFAKFKGDILQYFHDVSVVKKIIGYVSNVFFRNLKAYQYVFRNVQEVVEEVREVVVETALPCPSLVEGVLQE